MWNALKNNLKVRLRRWLDIDDKADALELEKLRAFVYQQVETVGIDVHWHGKPSQSQIIIVSRLGAPTGTISVKNAHFKNYAELMDFTKNLDRWFGEERVILDMEPSMSRMFQEDRNRRR